MNTTAQHLQTIIDGWPHLTDMLDTHTDTPWPPASRYTDYETALLATVRPRATVTELEVPAGQPPLNLEVLDTRRAVTAALLATADHTAAQIQRAPLSVDLARGWTDPIHRQAALLAARDAADPRRWPYDPTDPRRTAVYAAVWLQQRLDDTTAPDGPFRPLTVQQHDRIAHVAAEAARRIQMMLATARRRERLPHPCPHCRGRLVVEGGDGRPPVVRCGGCGWARTAEETAA
ncbi:hypothetical protein [Streptomyces sp. CNQ085]|uniref:hypothetical protein n=1 Tax=Streptomyces sp. CNQ085 TaxID=2886944 RepID=UPI001F514723|nr:hypothetical protein [Streptomyces sp. CNQ085]MCI0386187.1 hypothetical protein [Streptomyces sp. CNQ085]